MQRGFSLVEMLVVVAIMTLIGSGVAIAAYRHYVGAQIRAAEEQGRTIRLAVRAYWIQGGTLPCPGVADLVHASMLDEGTTTRDPWGSAWDVRCEDTRVSVASPGRDRVRETDDDIRVPPLSNGGGLGTPEALSGADSRIRTTFHR